MYYVLICNNLHAYLQSFYDTITILNSINQKLFMDFLEDSEVRECTTSCGLQLGVQFGKQTFFRFNFLIHRAYKVILFK